MCIDVGDQIANYGVFGITFHTECDPWVMPHLINIFLLYVLTRSAWISWTIAAVNEVIEVLFVVTVGNFIVFAGQTNFFFENMPNSVLLDFFIQATLGIILGKVYVIVMDPPRFLHRWERSVTIRYWIGFILVIVPQSFYDLYQVDLALPYGMVINVLAVTLVLGLVIWLEPRHPWENHSEHQRVSFWGLTFFIYVFFLGIGHLKASWVPSTAILSWILWGIFMLIFTLMLAADGTLWPELKSWWTTFWHY